MRSVEMETQNLEEQLNVKGKRNKWPKNQENHISVHITLAWRISITSASPSLSLRTINSHTQFDRDDWIITTKNDFTTRKCCTARRGESTKVGGRHLRAGLYEILFRRPGGKFSQNNDFLIQIPIWFCSRINSLFSILSSFSRSHPLSIHSMVHWHRIVWCRDGLTWIYCFDDHWLYWEIAMALFANILCLICNKNHWRLFHLAFSRNSPTEYQVLLWISIR